MTDWPLPTPLKERPEPETQWTADTSVVNHAHMYQYWASGLVGTKEFRNFLERISPDFKEIRDTAIDNQIDEMARERREQEQEMIRRLEKEEQESKQS